MDWKKEWKPLAWIVGFFLACYYLPAGLPRFDKAVLESLYLVKWYAREHVLLCLVPAFYIAGAIAVFVSQDAVMKYLGARANKVLAYGVASVSGTILAVCSCTVLPLFAGIYRMGAGLGPAVTFLYSGPAINVLAMILTARVLGLELGIARALGAVFFSVIIGLLMNFIFRKEEWIKANSQAFLSEPEINRPLWQNAVFFASLVGVLVFANWSRTDDPAGVWHAIYSLKWIITGLIGWLLAVLLIRWFAISAWKIILVSIFTVLLAILFPGRSVVPFVAAVLGLSLITSTASGEAGEWFSASWGFAKLILPLLLIGVLVSGALLGRPGEEGLIPSAWISRSVGGNSITANFVASFVGAFMYFATLTEVPILQGLIGSGMGKGPALALLLAGPALSLPSMLVINGILGTKKTVVFVTLVILMATLCGLLYGTFF
ncbi:MAG: permease [bacterium]